MSFLQIFVEDTHSDPYEILAARALGHDYRRKHTRWQKVRAAQLSINEFCSKDSLLDSVKRAYRTGARCVVFILDEEDHHNSPDRSAKLVDFRQAFMELCHYVKNLPDTESLKYLKVICIVSKSCLECWLLADPRAIVTTVNGPSSYQPPVSNTENHNPSQATDKIAHIIKEVGRRTKNRKWQRISRHSVKSLVQFTKKEQYDIMTT